MILLNMILRFLGWVSLRTGGKNDCDKRNLHVLRMVLISLRTPDRLELENHELNDVL